MIAQVSTDWPAGKHKWRSNPVARVPMGRDADGYVVRVCELCDVMKVTAYSRERAWREWRGHNGERWKVMPECSGVTEA